MPVINQTFDGAEGATVEAKLTKGDRCDKCGAQAYVHVVFHDLNELMFCGHHYKANEDKLREIAMMINNESDRLLNK